MWIQSKEKIYFSISSFLKTLLSGNIILHISKDGCRKISQRAKQKRFHILMFNFYSACCLVRPWMEELIPEKNSLEKISKPLKRWMGRSQLLPEIVENVLQSLWWGNGSKQPSPCLQPPKVGGLLKHLLLLLKAPLPSLHFWSQI